MFCDNQFARRYRKNLGQLWDRNIFNKESQTTNNIGFQKKAKRPQIVEQNSANTQSIYLLLHYLDSNNLTAMKC